jgi:hypothetical protein
MGGAWPRTMGYGATDVWIDEAVNIDPRVHDALARKAEIQTQLARRKIVDPLEIICRRCNAAVGVKCTDTNRRRTFERKPHRRRKDDARIVQDAANAMLTRRRLSAP